MYMPEIVGSGAALFDYGNDGDLVKADPISSPYCAMGIPRRWIE